MIDEQSLTGNAVVIGAGTMGGGIAAQLANAGWQVRLLDVAGPDPNDKKTRNLAAQMGLDRLIKNRPALLFLPEYAGRIQVGNTTDNLDWLESADWVVEAVVENREVKASLLAQIEACVSSEAVVTSNTSGLSLTEMAVGRSASFRSRFFGSHFLNPPRYLKLLELVPTADSDAERVAGFQRFAEGVLGHRVVITKDTPGFISTRIWIEHLLESIRIAVEQGLTVSEADYLTGPLLGRPRSATFRMADLVGLDIIAAIAANQFAGLPEDMFRERLQLPGVVEKLIASGRLGEKTGAGFYKREGRDILVLDLQSGEYVSRQEVRIDAVEALLKRPLAERLAAFSLERATRWGAYLESVLDSLTDYVNYAAPSIAETVLDIDHVMRWGFQWEQGPFELQDSRKGEQRYYAGSGQERKVYRFASETLVPAPTEPEYATLAALKTEGKTVFETLDGALVDMGDGVVCLEMRTKMNTFGPGLCETVNQARERAEKEFRALIIGSDAPYFSAGFNLKLLLEAYPKGDWSGIDAMLHEVQATFMGLKYAKVPTVAAVRGYTLGGGCECAFSCAAIQASPELIMGLPELPVGLIPSGGAFKELLFRTMEGWDGASDPYPRLEKAFDLIVTAPNTGSAAEARKIGLLRNTDSISHNADRLLYDAKHKALALANAGYRPPAKRGVWVLGQEGLARLRMAIHWHCGAHPEISAYDRHIADRIAYVMCGGDLSHPQEVSEQYLLNLERKVFQTLVSDARTEARIRHMLETGKPLKN